MADMGERREYTRRALLGAAAATGAGMAMAAADGAPAAAASNEAAGGRRPVARESLTVVDEQGRQRFLAATRKPPVIIDGQVLPPSRRQGDDDATWLIFNEEHGSERGGIVAASDTAQLTLDFANAQGITMGTSWQGKTGLAAVSFNEMPDPSLPIEQVSAAPQRAALGWVSEFGAVLSLNDSRGRTRILLQVDNDDVARIKILDAHGNVVAQLPPG
jgi:hypothetical protein